MTLSRIHPSHIQLPNSNYLLGQIGSISGITQTSINRIFSVYGDIDTKQKGEDLDEQVILNESLSDEQKAHYFFAAHNERVLSEDSFTVAGLIGSFLAFKVGKTLGVGESYKKTIKGIKTYYGGNKRLFDVDSEKYLKSFGVNFTIEKFWKEISTKHTPIQIATNN